MFKFLTKNFEKAFGRRLSPHYQPPPTVMKKLKPLKAAYADIHHEYFLFKKGKIVIGWSYGEMDDFETYYMRNTAVLPEFRGTGVYSEFLEQFLRYLQALGYQRVSSQHHPDNLNVIKAKMKAGFMIVGTENHERWGQLLKLVRIFDPKRERFFKKKYL